MIGRRVPASGPRPDRRAIRRDRPRAGRADRGRIAAPSGVIGRVPAERPAAGSPRHPA
jgi:hypothetical protein